MKLMEERKIEKKTNIKKTTSEIREGMNETIDTISTRYFSSDIPSTFGIDT